MHIFKEGDCVSFIFNRKQCYGCVQTVGEKNASVWVEDLEEIKKIPLARLTYVPPVSLKPEQMRRFCRYEVRWSELTAGRPDYFMTLEVPYMITLEDILAAAHNIKDSGYDNETVKTEWYFPLYDLIYEYEEDILFETSPADVELLEYLPDRQQFLNDLLYCDLDLSMVQKSEPIGEAISDIIERIEKYIEDEHKPILERDYSESYKDNYVSQLGKDDRLKKATEFELKVYRKFIEDLITKDNHTALRCKGYGCYGGDPAYECDWDTALECITRLYELTGEPVYANTLGYIYYYGRCWDGEPKYDEAFKYFSVGAAGFYYESRYKLADMFVHGYGVPKNPEIAYSLVSELYDQNVKYILDGKFDCKFADIALRLGSYAEKGYGKYVDHKSAYRYYLQADFAIRQRLQYDHYGDLSVADSIRKSLSGIFESGDVSKPKKTAYVDPRELLYLYLKKYRKLQLDIKPLKNGDVKLSIRIAPFREEKYPPKLFITQEETGFCGMLEKLTLRVENASVYGLDNNSSTVSFDDLTCSYKHDSKTDTFTQYFKFMLGDDIQASVAGEFKFTSPIKSSGKKYKFASVYFSPGGKHYDYLLDIDDVEAGDTVYVMTDRGKTEVTVASVLEKYESELALPIGKYKKVVEKK